MCCDVRYSSCVSSPSNNFQHWGRVEYRYEKRLFRMRFFFSIIMYIRHIYTYIYFAYIFIFKKMQLLHALKDSIKSFSDDQNWLAKKRKCNGVMQT